VAEVDRRGQLNLAMVEDTDGLCDLKLPSAMRRRRPISVAGLGPAGAAMALWQCLGGNHQAPRIFGRSGIIAICCLIPDPFLLGGDPPLSLQ